MITIRMMAGDEVKPALKLARKAFAGIECLFISKPKTGIVALIDNQIVGGVFVKQISIQNGSLGYLDTVFVDPACQGQGHCRAACSRRQRLSLTAGLSSAQRYCKG